MKIPDWLIALVIILLVLSNVVFFIRAKTFSHYNSEYSLVLDGVKDFVVKFGFNKVYPECASLLKSDPVSYQSCLSRINSEVIDKKMFSLKKFNNARPEINQTGFLIVKYDRGAEKFNSSGFVLSFNHEIVDRGCSTPGMITPGYSCRLDFNKKCSPGDNLEVLYNGKRVLIQSC